MYSKPLTVISVNSCVDRNYMIIRTIIKLNGMHTMKFTRSTLSSFESELCTRYTPHIVRAFHAFYVGLHNAYKTNVLALRVVRDAAPTENPRVR